MYWGTDFWDFFFEKAVPNALELYVSPRTLTCILLLI